MAAGNVAVLRRSLTAVVLLSFLACQVAEAGQFRHRQSPLDILTHSPLDDLKKAAKAAEDAAAKSVEAAKHAANAAEHDLKDAATKAAKAAEDAAKAAEESAKKGANDGVDEVKKQWEKTEALRREAAETVVKPLMNSINIMRADMCWRRPDFWAHEKCIKFLGVACMGGSTGKGICHTFATDMAKKCAEEGIMTKDICDFIKKLGILPEPKAKQEEVSEEGGESDEQKGPDQDGDLQTDGVGGNADGDAKVNSSSSSISSQTNVTGSSNSSSSSSSSSSSGKAGSGEGGDAGSSSSSSSSSTSSSSSSVDAGGSGAGDADSDGDGYPDSKDAFPHDPKEWGDFDNDGIGDNSDPDVDGDGTQNDEDVDPWNSTKSFKDSDGDGVTDKEDAFPNDPTETKDSDGDGVGDNADEFPVDARCHTSPCKRASDANGDGIEDAVVDGFVMNKVGRPLPPDGYDEYTPGMVEHKDMKTHTGDWQKESPLTDESYKQAMERICAQDPDNEWCNKNGHRPS